MLRLAMGWRGIVAFAATVAACSGGANTQEPTSTPILLDASFSPGTSVLGGTCPDQGDAVACPELGGEPAWVGCTRLTAGTNTAALQSCTCLATGTGEGAWECEATDASPPVGSVPACLACVKTPPPASSDGSTDAIADAGSASDGPNITAGQCVLSKGVWYCGGAYGNVPACPASLTAACSTDAGSCFVCQEGAGQTYGCVDGGWLEGLPTETGCSP